MTCNCQHSTPPLPQLDGVTSFREALGGVDLFALAAARVDPAEARRLALSRFGGDHESDNFAEAMTAATDELATLAALLTLPPDWQATIRQWASEAARAQIDRENPRGPTRGSDVRLRVLFHEYLAEGIRSLLARRNAPSPAR